MQDNRTLYEKNVQDYTSLRNRLDCKMETKLQI